MSLDQGKRIKPDEFKQKVWWQNYNRLQTWCNIGSDVDNGLWAIHGARLGCKMTVLSDWDTNQHQTLNGLKSFLIMKYYHVFQVMNFVSTQGLHGTKRC